MRTECCPAACVGGGGRGFIDQDGDARAELSLPSPITQRVPLFSPFFLPVAFTRKFDGMGEYLSYSIEKQTNNRAAAAAATRAVENENKFWFDFLEKCRVYILIRIFCSVVQRFRADSCVRNIKGRSFELLPLLHTHGFYL